MTRIIADVHIYNGGQFLSSVLYRIHEYVDEIIVIDGAWRGLLASGLFPGPASTDNSKEIFKSLKLDCDTRWIDAPPKGWESHAHKRAAAHKYFKKGDWEYLINDDEMAIGNVPKCLEVIRNTEDVQCIGIRFIELIGVIEEINWTKNTLRWLYRFFKIPEGGLRYGHTHIDLMTAEGQNFRGWTRKQLEIMQIVHLKRLRPPVMRDRKSDKRNIYDCHVRGSKKILLA